MSPKLLIYTAIVLAEIACGYAGLWTGVYLLKPLIMISLLFWRSDYRRSRPVFWIGMCFALSGDIFLMIREKDLFVAGLGSFLLMQLCYIFAFIHTFTPDGKAFLASAWWKIALPFAVYGAIFLAVLYPSIARQAHTRGLWWPVVAYAVCLCSMGTAAAFRQRSVPEAGYRWVLAGAVLFILSDSVIAFNKFLQPFAASSLLVMTTYAAAQWLIVWGIGKR